MVSIVILVASTGKNVQLADEFKQSLTRFGAQVEVIDLCALDLPLYTPEKDQQGVDLPGFAAASQKVQDAIGMVVCAPEYNGSMPPVLSNFVAWLSTSTDDFRAHFNGKNIALASHSGGGGHNLMTSMRIQFSHLGGNVLGRVALVNKSKPMNQSTIDALSKGVMQ